MPPSATQQPRPRARANRTQRFRFGLCMSLAIVALGLTYCPAKISAASNAATIAFRMNKHRVGKKLPDNVRIIYAGPPDLVRALESGVATATALGAADFDLDGAVDLLIGYRTSGGGVIALLRGNPDAYAPKDPSLYRAAMRGQMPPTFLSTANVFAVPESPDLLATGDFDRDGHQDLLVGTKGGALYVLKGDGRGNLLTPQLVALPGEITALDVTPAGQVAVGTDGPDGSQLVVFAPSRRGLTRVAIYPLPASATSVAWGALGGGTGTDLAVASGTSVVVIYNALSAQAHRATIDLRFDVEALTLGNFIWDRNGTTEIAVLGDDGMVRILRHGRLDTRSFMAADLPARQTMRPPSIAAGRWTVIKRLGLVVSSSSEVAAQSMLQSPRLTVSPTHDLMMVDAPKNQIIIFDTSRNNSSEPTTVRFSSTPMAAYATPPKIDGGRDLVVLTSAQLWPVIIQFGTPVTVIVNTTADTDPQNACTNNTILPEDLQGSISLRTAVCAADNYGSMGAVTINVPPGSYQLTSLDTGELQLGLVPGSNILIVGTGTATDTIIQQTASMARVFNFDPNMVGNVTGAVSNITVTGGNAASPGGGGMLAGYIGDSYTVADVVFENNTSSGLAASGGAIELRGGSLSMINCTITNNIAQVNAGGGIAITNGVGSRGNVSLISTVITGNSATGNGSSPGQGGGIFVAVDSGSSAIISGSTVSLNSATGSPGRGGGIFNQGGPLSVIDSRIVANQAGDASGIYTQGFDVMATDNWWGCNGGPGTSGCDTVDGIGGNAAFNPWLVLSISASPAEIKPNATSALSADLTHDSGGSSGFNVPDGTPIGFSGMLGSVQPSQTILVNGIAASTYTAGPNTGAGQATATVDNQSVDVVIDIVQAPAITSGSQIIFTAGRPGMFRITTVGFPIPTITEGGTLPNGVAFGDNGDGTGILAGSPAAGTGGRYNVTFTAQNGVLPNAQQNFMLTIDEAPAISSADNTNFQVGAAGSFTVTATGFPTPNITEIGTLPNGIQFVDHQNGSATLSGSPSTAGIFNIQLQAANSAGNAEQKFSLAVQKGNSSTILGSSSNPSILNQNVVFGALVSANGSVPPTGEVMFSDGGTGLGTSDLDGSGTAKLSIASLAEGTHNVAAAYNGDSNYASSTSAILLQIVKGAAQFSLTGNPSVVSVAAGTQARLTVTATGENEFNSAVSLACASSTLPTGVFCQFSPASITPGARPATSTLAISTSVTSAGAKPSFTGGQPSSLYAIWLMMPALLVSIAGVCRTGRRRLLSYGLAFALIACSLLQGGCGAGMSVGSKTGTLPGSYEILVTGSSNGVTQTTAITLIVL